MSIKLNDTVKLIGRLRDLIKETNRPGVELTSDDDGYYEEGDWLYLIVNPAKPGIRAYEYVERLQELEARLRREFDNPNILLVPARGD